MPDKNRIAKNFSKAAKKYDEAAEIQRIAAKKLCEFFAKNFEKKNGFQALDLGSGTSFVAKNLISSGCFLVESEAKIFELDLSAKMLASWVNRPSNVIPIQGDIEKISAEKKFEKNSFDAVLSSFALQWIDDFDRVFLEIFSLLKSDGIFVFCLPLFESLSELKSEKIFRFNDLPKISNVISSLKNSGFASISSHEEIITQNFSNPILALKSIKEVGANSLKKSEPIFTKTQAKQLRDFCLKNSDKKNKNLSAETPSNARQFSLSWHVAFLICRKK